MTPEERASELVTEWVNAFMKAHFPKAQPVAFENMAKNWEHLIPLFAQALRAARDDALESFVPGLAKLYNHDEHYQMVAEVCDEVLDPSGRLLGYVRIAARALKDAQGGSDG